MSKKSLWDKFLDIRKKVPYLQNDKDGYGFKYTSTSKVLTTLNEYLNAEGIMLTPVILSHEKERVMKKKKVTNGNNVNYIDHYETLYTINMEMRWRDVESGDEIVIPWMGVGVNGDEMGFGSALTYAKRYFLLQFFNIPTDEADPEEVQKQRYTEEIGRVKLTEAVAKQKEHDGLTKPVVNTIETPKVEVKNEPINIELVKEKSSGELYTKEELEGMKQKELVDIVTKTEGMDIDDIPGERKSAKRIIDYILGMQMVSEEEDEKQMEPIEKTIPEDDEATEVSKSYQADLTDLIFNTDFIADLYNGQRSRHEAMKVFDECQKMFGISRNMAERYMNELFKDKFSMVDYLFLQGTKQEIIQVIQHHQAQGN